MTERDFLSLKNNEASRNFKSKFNNNGEGGVLQIQTPEFIRFRNEKGEERIPQGVNPSPPPLQQAVPKKRNEKGGFGIPILDSILSDGDSTLIIGLLLLLMSEKSDKILLFALVYILL